MEKIIILILCSLCISSCEVEKIQGYPITLEELKLNYTQYYEEMEAADVLSFYFELYTILSEDDHKKRVESYEEAVHRFYNSDKGMIDYLLGFRRSQLYNEWLFIEESPLSSNIVVAEIMKEPEAALMLIDYFLRGKKQPLNAIQKLPYLTYEDVLQFYEHNKHKTLYQIRKSYRQFILPPLREN